MNPKTANIAGRRHDETDEFHGFTRLDANFLYCPNQFLDVCLPNSSRSVVRLVAFILDQTLGWLDEHGNPISQDIIITYNQLIRSAGISRGAIRKAIDDAVAGNYIRCIQQGKAAAAGDSPEQASYALCWDDGGEYRDDPDTFVGFYAGEGYRTPIPNAYFRHVIPNETLTVTKVVGTVLRHTVGYQNQFGGRRSQAPLSYRFIQRYANIPDPKTLSEAISSAIASQYIVCIDEGVFHQDQNLRRPATYGVKWLHDVQNFASGSKYPAEGRFNKLSSPPVQKTQQDRSNIPSSTGSENPVAGRFNKPSKEKTRQKNTLKQQQSAAAEKGFQLDRFLNQLDRTDLLICDELGYLSFSRGGAELLFQVFAERYERRSLLITSNLAFSDWGQIFQGERMTAALLDRLTHHCEIFEMNGESYRFKESMKQKKQPRKKA